MSAATIPPHSPLWSTQVAGGVDATDVDIFRSVFDRSGMWMARLDTRGRIVEVNARLADALGRPAAELRGRSFDELLNHGQRERFRWNCAAVRAGLRAGFVESFVAIGSDARSFSSQVTAIAVRPRSDLASSIIIVVTPERTTCAQPITLTKLSALVLEGVAAGASTTELASKLHLSPQGVEYHVTTMLRKFEASNRAALVARAYASGILTMGSWPPQVAPEALK